MRRLCLFLLPAFLLAAALAVRPHADAAAVAGVEQCRNRMLNELTTVRDEERAHVFGSHKDRDGHFKVLTGGDDTQIHIGILETRERLTSELVEPLVESYKTMRCKAAAVCAITAESIHRTGGGYEVDLLGCEKQTVNRYDECFIGALAPTEQAGVLQDISNIQTQCDTYVSDTLTAERAVLRLAVAYDAGYRSTLQFAGMMNWMMEDLPTRAIRPIRDMVNMLGKLHEIPCFIGQCDNPDTSGIAP